MAHVPIGNFRPALNAWLGNSVINYMNYMVFLKLWADAQLPIYRHRLSQGLLTDANPEAGAVRGRDVHHLRRRRQVGLVDGDAGNLN